MASLSSYFKPASGAFNGEAVRDFLVAEDRQGGLHLYLNGVQFPYAGAFSLERNGDLAALSLTIPLDHGWKGRIYRQPPEMLIQWAEREVPNP